MIFTKHLESRGVADGTIEADLGTLQPETGKEWHLVGIKLNLGTSAGAIVYTKINRRDKCAYYQNNLPDHPDLIPLDDVITATDKYSFTITNDTGGAIDFFVDLYYEERTAGGG